MPVTRGQIIFAIVFFLCFVVGMIWAYRSDRKVNRTYYRGVYLVLLALIVFIALYNLAVKLFNR
jgi:cbb3-type cytochrome oxidase subunit 3